MQVNRLRRGMRYRQSAAAAAVAIITVVVLLASCGGALAEPRYLVSREPDQSGDAGPTVTETVRLTVVETVQASARPSGPEMPTRRQAPVAALRFDNGLSADSLTNRANPVPETWVAASSKGLSYSGMTAGVAFAFAAVLLIGGLVVPVVVRKRRTGEPGRPAPSLEYW